MRRSPRLHSQQNESTPRGDIAQPPDHESENTLGLIDSFAIKVSALKAEVGEVIVGQEHIVDQILIALLAGGHAMLEGVPGLAKTLIVEALASSISLDFGRVQFTPDLMPADITGTQVIGRDPRAGTSDRRSEAGDLEWGHFRKGPIFVHILLADEINRTPPKTQAALLEAMAEGGVSIAGQRYSLPEPFLVLATQNPIEQEGTYSLPEAQLDRFLFKILIDYPTLSEEETILRRTTGADTARTKPVLSRQEILGLQRVVRALSVSPHILEYATRLVRRSRPELDGNPEWVRQWISWGAGPRAVQALVLAAKAQTLLRGRFCVTRDAVRDVALPALRHRLIPSFTAEGEGLTADDIVCRLIMDTPSFPEEGVFDGSTRTILRR